MSTDKKQPVVSNTVGFVVRAYNSSICEMYATYGSEWGWTPSVNDCCVFNSIDDAEKVIDELSDKFDFTMNVFVYQKEIIIKSI